MKQNHLYIFQEYQSSQMAEFQGQRQNHFTFQIKNPGSTKNKTSNNTIAMKKIDNYSYAMSDEIGLGFTSHVYKGRCDLTNQQVAIKVIELKKNSDELQANFLKQEVAVLQTIKDADPTNLLKLEKVVQTKHNLYIITQFCEGNDLAKILRKKKLFTQIQAQSIMKQVLNGYKQLYNLRIVHRDLKLANFFITKGLVKIADFGFAIGEKQCMVKMDYNVGSPYYMPPQSLKLNQYSFLSDVWALGVIAYQLVYGRVPWKDKDDHVLYDMIMGCPVERLFDSDKQVSDHYKNFIKNCLQIDRRFRASPQFIINYHWPFAQQYVEGLQDNNQYRFDRNTMPRLSLQRPQLNKITHNGGSEQRLMRKRTPSADNLRNLGRSEQMPPLYKPFPPKKQSIVTKSFIQPQRFVVTELSRQKIQKNSQRSRQSQSQSRQVIDKDTQNVLVGQLHYCRFMFELYKILKNKLSKNDRANRVSTQLSLKVMQKMKLIVKIAQNQENLLNLEGFNNYIRTERWQKLRQVVYKYDLSFRQNLSQDFSASSKNIQSSSQLVQLIRQLKGNMSSNLKTIQFLVYYYQIKELQYKNHAKQLIQKTKLEYLVEQCKYYSSNAEEQTQGQEGESLQRLRKKLYIIGL